MRLEPSVWPPACSLQETNVVVLSEARDLCILLAPQRNFSSSPTKRSSSLLLFPEDSTINGGNPQLHRLPLGRDNVSPDVSADFTPHAQPVPKHDCHERKYEDDR